MWRHRLSEEMREAFDGDESSRGLMAAHGLPIRVRVRVRVRVRIRVRIRVRARVRPSVG